MFGGSAGRVGLYVPKYLPVDDSGITVSRVSKAVADAIVADPAFPHHAPLQLAQSTRSYFREDYTYASEIEKEQSKASDNLLKIHLHIVDFVLPEEPYTVSLFMESWNHGILPSYGLCRPCLLGIDIRPGARE